MGTRVISNIEIKDEDVTKLVFSVNPSCSSTLNTIKHSGESYLIISCEDCNVFIDKHSIGSLILALQEAKRLLGRW